MRFKILNGVLKGDGIETTLKEHKNDLCDADLHGVNLRFANLSGADLRRVKLNDADLRGIDLHDAILCDADLRGADLYGANLRNTRLRNIHMHDADLCDADLCDADLRRAKLSGSDCSNANLDGACLNDADLRDADLHGADLRKAKLQGVDLTGADLRGAFLCGADLSRAKLCYADLRCAFLDGADMRGANLRNAQTEKACLRDADLRNAIDVPSLLSAQTSILPDEGDIIGWKKALTEDRRAVIVKLLIPADAKRCNGTSRVCRADKALVLDLLDKSSGNPLDDTTAYDIDRVLAYRKGETIQFANFVMDRWKNKYASGVHFFITREEAEAAAIAC